MTTPRHPTEASSVGSGEEDDTAEASDSVVASPAASLTPDQRDSCLRVMHLKATADAMSAHTEASDLFPGKPLETLLYQGLKVSHERSTSLQGGSEEEHPEIPTFRTFVFRDFDRLYRRLLPQPPIMVVGGTDQRPGAQVPLRPHSLLVAARNVLDRLSLESPNMAGGSSAAPENGQQPQQQQPMADFGTFVTRSLGQVVNEVTAALTSIKDWDRMWDVVRTKFVHPLPVLEHHETSGTSQEDAIAIDDDDDDISDGNHSGFVLGTEAPSYRQVEVLAWKLFCVGWRCLPPAGASRTDDGSPDSVEPTGAATTTTTTTEVDGDSSSSSEMRRIRMTVAGGALVLFAALYEACFPARGPGDPDEPGAKRIRVATLAQSLVDAIKDPAARMTRYGIMHSTANALVGGDITASEIENQAKALAKLIWRVTAASSSSSSRLPTMAQREKGPVSASPKVYWIRELEGVMFGDESSGRFLLSTDQVVPLLAKTVDNLYTETNLKPPNNSDGFVYDVGTLVELDSLDALDDPLHNRIHLRLADKFSTANRAVVAQPPVFTEAMELNEWAVSLMGIHVAKPSSSLFDMLESAGPGAVMKHVVPALNRALYKFGDEFVTERPASRQMLVYVVDTGRVMIYGEETSDKKFARAVVAMYYHALEALLVCERCRLLASPIGAEETPLERVNETLYRRLISSQPFHSALLTCSLLCVHKAVGATQLMMNHLHSFSALHVCECHPEDFLKVSDSFRRCLSGNTLARGNVGSTLAIDLPRILLREVATAERNTLDVFLWRGVVNSFMGRIEGLRERRIWPPDCLGPDEDDDPDVEDAKSKILNKTNGFSELRSVAYIFRRVLSVASARIVSLLEFLRVHPRPVVARQVYVALRYLLRRHVDLLHDRHLDHMILCCIYGVGKQLQYEPPITFVSLINAYVAVRGEEEGDITCQRIVRHIKLVTVVDDTDDEPVGNIIQLYNIVFVPLMKDYLLKSTSLQRAAALLKDPAADQRSTESIAGAIQFSIQGSGGGVGGDRLGHSAGAMTAVEIGAPSSSKAAELANDATRQRVPT